MPNRKPILTVALISACILVTLITKFGEADNTWWFYFSFSEIQRGQIWRILSPIFLHFDFLHLAFNMIWLWYLGSDIEDKKSSWFLALQVVLLGMISNASQAVASGSGFGGMSGVVYGLFGYVWVRGKLDPFSDLRIGNQSAIIMMVWLFVCYTGRVGQVANTAHTTGLLAGAVWGFIAAKWRKKRKIAYRPADAFHECVICKRTDATDPHLDFRVGADGREYCKDHLQK
jgi:GlpG protein